MKKLVVVLCLALSYLHGQELTVKWSQKMEFDSKKLFFNEYIGANSKYIYADFSQSGLSRKKIKLVAFDKQTFKQVAECPIKGFPENEMNKKELKDLLLEKTIVFENLIYVFWIKENKEKDELFVQTFNSNLKPQNRLKKIYELKSTKGDKKRAELFIMGNKKVGEKLIIGGELSGAKGEKVKIEFKVLNADLTTTTAYQIELPLEITGRSDRLASDYRYGDDGNLYVKFEHLLLSIDPLTGKKVEFDSEYKDKKIFDFAYIETKNSVKIFGMFSDIKKDKYGNDIHGIYNVTLENGTFKVKENNFTYFTKDQLDKIFAKDKEDRKDKNLFASKKKKDSEESSLGSNYSVEQLLVDGDDMILFCSKMYNYTRSHTTTTNGVTSTTYTYHCQKDNVTGFRLSPDGKITWASNIDRRITYNNWYVYDVNVVKKNEKYYVIYGSTFEEGKSKKGCFSAKSKRELRDNLEYATFDSKTGIATKNNYIINPKNTPKKERKSISPLSISVMENEFYMYDIFVRPRLITCIIPPLYYCTPFFPSLTVGSGYLGSITTK